MTDTDRTDPGHGGAHSAQAQVTLAFDRLAFQHAMIDAGVKSIPALAAATGLARAMLWAYGQGLIPPPPRRELIARVLRVEVAALWFEARRPGQ